MAYQPGLSIEGLQKAQQRNLRRMALLEPTGAPGRAVQEGGAEMFRYLLVNMPWQTGSLRASRRMTFNANVPRLQIFTSGVAYNPRSDTRPAEYDVYLHARGEVAGLRGGIQASFPYTKRMHGPAVLQKMGHKIQMELKGL